LTFLNRKQKSDFVIYLTPGIFSDLCFKKKQQTNKSKVRVIFLRREPYDTLPLKITSKVSTKKPKYACMNFLASSLKEL